MKKIIFAIAGVVLLTIGFASCSKDFLETAPSGSLGKDAIVKDASGLHGILNGIHNMMYTYNWDDAHVFGTGHRSVGAQLDFMGDDVLNTLPAYFMSVYRYQDHINPDGDINSRIWKMYYAIISHANLVIEGAEANKDLSELDKNILLGEGYAFRAMAYHMLVQCFGHRYVAGGANDYLGVPLRLSSTATEPMARNTVAEVYKQIDEDMNKSLSHLSKVGNRDRKNVISYSAALGLAARIALCKSDWTNAAKYTNEAINKTSATLQKGKELLDGSNNWAASEWIWGYKQAPDQDNSYYSFYANYSYNFAGYNRSLRFAVNRDIFDKMGKNDVRRDWWVALDQNDEVPSDAYAQYFPTNGSWETTGQSIKFKSAGAASSIGDYLVMRLAELYYIKAEAEARMGQDAQALATLKKIMITRDPEYNFTGTGVALIDEIMRNKRIDLWLEGQRFFDIKRLGIVFDRTKMANFNYLSEAKKKAAMTRNTGLNAANVPKSVESVYWQFAIPYDEVKVNPELIKQNPLSE